MITPMLKLLFVRERSGFLRASQLAGESTVRRSWKPLSLGDSDRSERYSRGSRRGLWEHIYL